MEIDTTQPALFLPQEIIEQILPNLAVKSLLRFRCVSKPWRSLIDSKEFIKTHLENSTKDISVLSVRIRGGEISTYCRYPWLPEKQPKIHAQELNIKYRTEVNKLPLDHQVSLVGCCNGLVCVVVNDFDFVIWNPSTRSFKKLPRICSNRRMHFCDGWGFFFDESGCFYKVIAVVYYDEHTECIVYSSENGSWKRMAALDEAPLDKARYDCFRDGVLARERLHLVELDGRWIDAFDFEKEVFGVVELPSSSEGFSFEIGLLGGFLSVWYSHESWTWSDVWVMKEYGVKDSWEKVIVVDNVDYSPLWTSPSLARFRIGGDGDRDGDGGVLLMKMEGMVISYVKFDEWCYWYMVGDPSCDDTDFYIESLVSPL